MASWPGRHPDHPSAGPAGWATWCGPLCLPAKGPVLIGIGLPHQQSDLSLSAALTAAYRCRGREVWNLGRLSYPGGSRQHPPPGSGRRCLMVSASHNPPEDNGIKLFGSFRAQTQQRVQPGHRKRCAVRPGPPATNDRGERFGAYPLRPGPPTHRTCWLIYSTALLERRWREAVCRAAKSFLILCWGSATACWR